MKEEVYEGGRLRVRTINLEESRTVQSDRNLASISSILARYDDLGIVDHLSRTELTFKDVSQFEDFTDLMRQHKVVESEFMQLPSKVREVFQHDVGQWLDAAHDPEKFEALRPRLEALGVLEPLPAPPPAPADPTPSADPSATPS